MMEDTAGGIAVEGWNMNCSHVHKKALKMEPKGTRNSGRPKKSWTDKL
jgi:hypothetical protein